MDGTGLTGDALTQAYRRAKDAGSAAQFVANTAISTVEMAVSILTAGGPTGVLWLEVFGFLEVLLDQSPEASATGARVAPILIQALA